MSWEHLKAELSKESFHSITPVTDMNNPRDDCWYCDSCGGKKEMYLIYIKDERFVSMNIGVLCQGCMVKWFRDLKIELTIPVPDGQQRLIIKEEPDMI